MIDEPFEDDDLAEAPPAPSAADPVSQRRIRDRVKRERAEAAEFWAGVFASPVGRREMWGVLDAANTFKKRFGTGPNGFPQPECTDYYDGERDLGQRLFMSWLAICPDGTMAMLKEYHAALRPAPKVRRTRPNDRAWPEEP